MKTKLKFLILFASLALIYSCKKDDTTTPTAPTTCDVKGTYTGTATSVAGNSSPGVYKLQDNNFVIGSVPPNTNGVTFGGYRNTCDSVIMSLYYNANNSYYLIQGRLSNNGNTISGSFKNLTIPSDNGTFTVSK